MPRKSTVQAAEREPDFMIKSMTAFGRARKSDGAHDVTVEVKSVNSRYFDCTVKLPRRYSFLEEKIKAYVQEKGTSRGKVEIFIGVDTLTDEGVEIHIDEGYAKGYIGALHDLRDRFSLADDISVMSVAACREVFTVTKAEDDAERDFAMIKPVLDSAVESFVAMRTAEGERIERDIRAKIDGIALLVDKVNELSELDIKAYRERLRERIKQMLDDNNINIDESRILTECAIFADRVAIDEEVTRLKSHFKAFDEILNSGVPSGRKIDFLLQEINRETNTIGSKANDLGITKIVVDIKAELEKIREQIQNIE